MKPREGQGSRPRVPPQPVPSVRAPIGRTVRPKRRGKPICFDSIRDEDRTMETASTRPASAAARFESIEQDFTESRHDPVAGRSTIFAPHRQHRPDEFQLLDSSPPSSLRCPFCHGNESETPAAVWVGRTSDSADDESSDGYSLGCQLEPDAEEWSVRVVPNKFPAVGPLRRRDAERVTSRGGALFQSHPVRGGHEVIIESPRHVQSLTQLDLAEVSLVFAAYRDRIRHWRSVSGIRYISVFKNVGRDAGASLQHAHGQLIATDALPSDVAGTVKRAERYRATTGCCLHCDLIRAEIKEKRRIIFQNESLVAYCPFASPLPYLVRITTKQHHDRFEDLPWPMIREVARITRRVIRWLERMKPGVAYNYLLHTRPPRSRGDCDAHHWSLEVFPRVSRMAGFEYSSHCMINPVLPETAAEQYRSCASAEDPRRGFHNRVG